MGYNVKRSRPKDNRSLLNKANLFVLSINTQKNTYYWLLILITQTLSHINVLLVFGLSREKRNLSRL